MSNTRMQVHQLKSHVNPEHANHEGERLTYHIPNLDNLLQKVRQPNQTIKSHI